MGPAHTELSAGGVEFDTAKGHGDMESDDFLSDEIVAWGEGAWDGDGDGLASLWEMNEGKFRKDKGNLIVRTDVNHVPLSV